MKAMPKNTEEIPTMRNYVGGVAVSISSIMSTSHPDGPQSATKPQPLILCCFVYILYKHTCGTDTRRHFTTKNLKNVDDKRLYEAFSIYFHLR